MKTTLTKTSRPASFLKLLALPVLLGVTVSAAFPATAEMSTLPSVSTATMGLSVVGAGGRIPDTAPVPIFKEELKFPYLQKDEEGWVIVEMDIGEDGIPYNTKVVGFEGAKAFRRSSLRALKKFRFVPAMLDGEPVAVAGKRYKVSYSYADS
jgi:hypothetical protein